MSDRSPPTFRSIGAPLDVDDEALDQLSGMMGVPSLVRAKPLPASPVETEKSDQELRQTEKLTIVIPGYLMDALRLGAASERTTVRHLVMSALRAYGYDIAEEDMVSDGRRARHAKTVSS